MYAQVAYFLLNPSVFSALLLSFFVIFSVAPSVCVFFPNGFLMLISEGIVQLVSTRPRLAVLPESLEVLALFLALVLL